MSDVFDRPTLKGGKEGVGERGARGVRTWSGKQRGKGSRNAEALQSYWVRQREKYRKPRAQPAAAGPA